MIRRHWFIMAALAALGGLPYAASPSVSWGVELPRELPSELEPWATPPESVLTGSESEWPPTGESPSGVTFRLRGRIDTDGSTGFVAFGGVNFWDGTTNTSLGAPLLFNYFNNSPGAFTATVTASSFINAVNFPNVLRITGDFFLIGDPSTITVNSVPEPSTFALAALGISCLLVRARRKTRRLAS